MTKIYFAGSIRGGRGNADLYFELIQYLKNYGKVLTEHVGDENLSSAGEDSKDDRFIHERDMELILSADAVVAEVSTPSLGVGYEIGRAVEANKRILCLFKKQTEKKLSAMIKGCPKVKNVEYQNLSEAKKAVDDFL